MKGPVRPRAPAVLLTVLILGIGSIPVVLAEEWPTWTTPEEAGFSSARMAEAESYWYGLEDAPVAASAVAFKGRLLGEYGDTRAPLWCHSVRKSFLSALYGIHVESGAIDLQATMAELGIYDEPPLTAEEEQARVIDLLRARSGVYHEAACESQGMKDARPERGSHPPGTFWYYNNWDFNVLGTIFRQQTARDIFQEFEERIAGPVGMEEFQAGACEYAWEMNYSIHPCYTFRMSARDRARFGQLFLQQGRWGGHQLVPEAWVAESTRKHSDTGQLGIGYGYMWWTMPREFFRQAFPRDSALHNLHAYTASGYGGQLIFVIPDAEMVLATAVNVPQGGDLPIQDLLPMWQRILTARGIVDLSIRRARIKPSTVTAGDTVRVAVKIKNRGAERSTATTVDVYLTPSPAGEGELTWVGSTRLKRVTEGGRRTVRLRPTLPPGLPPGTYHLVTAVDRGKTNYDLDRANNLNVRPQAITVR